MNITKSIVIHASLEDMWPVLRDFVGLTKWSNVVSEAHIEGGGPADRVGCIRYLGLPDGGFFRERLLALSDRDHYLSYSIEESALPVENYRATMRFVPITEGEGGTLGIWSAEFDVDARDTEAMWRVVGEQICAGGLRAIKQFFENH